MRQDFSCTDHAFYPTEVRSSDTSHAAQSKVGSLPPVVGSINAFMAAGHSRVKGLNISSWVCR